MNTRIKISTKKVFTFTFSILLMNTTHIHTEKAEKPTINKKVTNSEQTRSIYENISYLGTDNDISGVNNKLTANQAAVISDIADVQAVVDTLATSTEVTTLGTSALATAANLALVNTAVVTDIPASLTAIEGATFDTATDSLEVISNKVATATALATAQTSLDDIPTNAELTAAVSVGTAATILELQGSDGDKDITTLSTAVTTLGTSALATAVNLATAQTSLDDIPTNAELTTALADLPTNAELTTAVGVGTTATATNITNAQAALGGATFDTDTDSLEVISNKVATATALATAQTSLDDIPTNAELTTAVGVGTAATILELQGAGGDNDLTTITTAVDAILVDTAVIGDPLVNELASTVALVLGDPTADTPSASASIADALGAIEGATFATATDSLEAISDKIGTPTDADISTDIANVQTVVDLGATAANLSTMQGNVTSILEDTGTTLPATLAAIQGSGFVTGTDSLKVLSDNIDTISTATGTTIPNLIDALPTNGELTTAVAVNTSAIQGTAGATNTLTTIAAQVNTLGTDPLATSAQLVALGTSGDVSGLYGLLTTIVGLLTTDPVLSVTYAKSNAALTTTVAVSSGASVGTYNGNIVDALTAITTATTFATQSQTNTATAITALATAITSFDALITGWGSGVTPITSAYSEAEISGALATLNNALISLQSAQASV